MKRIALMTLALATVVGTANAGPVDPIDRAASKFNLFPAELSVSIAGLPTLVAGHPSVGQAINANGEVAGYGETDSGQRHAFFWSPANPSVLVDIDPLGGDSVQANGINDDGVVVGSKHDFFGTPQAFRWSAGTMTMLQPLSGYSGAVATDVNNAGQVVGWSLQGSAVRATMWQSNNAVVDLGNSLGAGTSRAQAINGAGQIVGQYTVSGQLHAYLLTPGSGVTDLGTLGGSLSSAFGLNESAWVVGSSLTDVGTLHAFLWSSPGPMLDLEPEGMSIAAGVNGSPHAVGLAFNGQTRPVLWAPGGLRQDLGTLAGSEMTSGFARGINTNDQVIGASHDGTITRPTIWTIGEVGTPPVDACGPNLVDKIDCLIAQVEEWELGNEGRARSLLVKLENAKKKVAQAEAHAARGRAGAGEGNLQAAQNMVYAMRNQVHAFVLARILEDQDLQDVAAIIEGTNP